MWSCELSVNTPWTIPKLVLILLVCINVGVYHSYRTLRTLISHSCNTRETLLQHSYSTLATLAKHSYSTRRTLFEHSFNTLALTFDRSSCHSSRASGRGPPQVYWQVFWLSTTLSYSFLILCTLFNPFILLLQVLARANEQDPWGWWPARVKMMKGEFAVVDYVGWDTNATEIVPTERVRKSNSKWVCVEISLLI